MRGLVLILIAVAVLVAMGVFQYVQDVQRADNFKVAVDHLLRDRFDDRDAKLEEAIRGFAADNHIPPARLVIRLTRMKQPGAGIVGGLMSQSHLKQTTRILRAEIGFHQSVLFLNPSFDFIAQAQKVHTEPPHESEIQDALRSIRGK